MTKKEATSLFPSSEGESPLHSGPTEATMPGVPKPLAGDESSAGGDGQSISLMPLPAEQKPSNGGPHGIEGTLPFGEPAEESVSMLASEFAQWQTALSERDKQIQTLSEHINSFAEKQEVEGRLWEAHTQIKDAKDKLEEALRANAEFRQKNSEWDAAYQAKLKELTEAEAKHSENITRLNQQHAQRVKELKESTKQAIEDATKPLNDELKKLQNQLTEVEKTKKALMTEKLEAENKAKQAEQLESDLKALQDKLEKFESFAAAEGVYGEMSYDALVTLQDKFTKKGEELRKQEASLKRRENDLNRKERIANEKAEDAAEEMHEALEIKEKAWHEVHTDQVEASIRFWKMFAIIATLIAIAATAGYIFKGGKKPSKKKAKAPAIAAIVTPQARKTNAQIGKFTVPENVTARQAHSSIKQVKLLDKLKVENQANPNAYVLRWTKYTAGTALPANCGTTNVGEVIHFLAKNKKFITQVANGKMDLAFNTNAGILLLSQAPYGKKGDVELKRPIKEGAFDSAEKTAPICLSRQ